ncbi:MAG: response regulator [Velocimicrobium sp.]
MIKVLIVDDQEIVREGLKMILSLHQEIEIVGEAMNGQDLIEKLTQVIPEVILMDIRMPVMDGIEATRRVKQAYPQIKIIILTTFDEDEYIFQVLKNGADGYILKDSSSKEITNSIITAYEGSVLLNPRIASRVVSALNQRNEAVCLDSSIGRGCEILSELTQRETEVVKHIMQGKSNRKIGEDMFVTEGTIKNYVSKILEKYELKSRTELVIYLQKKWDW